MRKALAVDLDGTLLSTNTFRDYLSFCATAAIHRFRPDIALSITGWVLLRKLRFISHERMKGQLLRRTTSFMLAKGRLDDFVEHELLSINHAVLRLVGQYGGRGHLLILCTAAPSLYARTIAESLRLDLCCATPLPSEIVIGEWHENVGQRKVDALSRMLQVHNAELDVVITDHHDDLPLLNYNEGSNFLVAPSPKTMQIIKKDCKKPFSLL